MKIIKHIKHKLNQPLPGVHSHEMMLPPGRKMHPPGLDETFRHSAVLLLLYPEGNEINLCFIRRPYTMKNHAGQIAFPGGKAEKEDVDLIDTALRETEEEIGVSREVVEILRVISPVYVQVSGFMITPVVAWTNTLPHWKVDRSEVEAVITLPLREITNAANNVNREVETSTGKILVPGYEIEGFFIWGATAMILSELIELIKEPT